MVSTTGPLPLHLGSTYQEKDQRINIKNHAATVYFSLTEYARIPYVKRYTAILVKWWLDEDLRFSRVLGKKGRWV